MSDAGCAKRSIDDDDSSTVVSLHGTKGSGRRTQISLPPRKSLAHIGIADPSDSLALYLRWVRQNHYARHEDTPHLSHSVESQGASSISSRDLPPAVPLTFKHKLLFSKAAIEQLDYELEGVGKWAESKIYSQHISPYSYKLFSSTTPSMLVQPPTQVDNETTRSQPPHSGKASGKEPKKNTTSSPALILDRRDDLREEETVADPLNMQYLARTSNEVQSPFYKSHMVFAILLEKLGSYAYSSYCNRYFGRWESIGEELGLRESQAYLAYTHALEILQGVAHTVELNQLGLHDANELDPRHSRSRPQSTQHPTSSANRSPQAGNCSIKSSSKNLNPQAKKSNQKSKSGQDVHPTITLSDLSAKRRVRKVDCPIYKHHLMHGTTPPCNGCSKEFMSQVRSHLNPNRSQRHGNFPAFLAQCARCKLEFVDAPTYDQHIVDISCEHNPQHRGDIILPWAKLYLTIYPGAAKVPVPFTDAADWLPDEVIEKCRSVQALCQQTISTASSPFLDEHAMVLLDCDQMLSMDALSAENVEVDAALGVMLNDALRPYTSDEDLLVFAPELQNDRNEPPYSTDISEDVVLMFLTRLEEASSSFYRALHDAPQYLTDSQIQFMAGQVEQLHNNMRAYQQQQPNSIYDHTADKSIGGESVEDMGMVSSVESNDRAAPSIFHAQPSSSSESHDESNALRCSAQTSSQSSLTELSSDDERDLSMFRLATYSVPHNCVQPDRTCTSQSSANIADISTHGRTSLSKQPIQHGPAEIEYMSVNWDQSELAFSGYIGTTSSEQAHNLGDVNQTAHGFQYDG